MMASFLLFDRALPISRRALDLVNAQGAIGSMSIVERLAAALLARQVPCDRADP